MTQKITKICFKYNVFCFQKNFCEYIRMENPGYKNENINRKYLNNMWKNEFVKVRNSLLE